MTQSSITMKGTFFLCLFLAFIGHVFAGGSTFYKVTNIITGEERLEEHQHVGDKITVMNAHTKKVLYTSECFSERSLCIARDEFAETTINHIDKIANLKNRETIRSLVFVKLNNERSLVIIGVTVTMVHTDDKKWVMVRSVDNTNYINTLIGPSDDYRKPDYTEHIIVNPESGLPLSHEISVRTDIEI